MNATAALIPISPEASLGFDTDRLDRDGPASLSDVEALAMLVGGGAPARRLLARAGSLRVLASWSAPEISASAPLPSAVALTVLAAFELGRRAFAERRTRGETLASSIDVYRHFAPLLRDERREVFMAALLDVKNRLLRDVRISQGSLSASLVHPREAFSAAVREPAHGILFVHNHPSGDPTPSDEDIALTKRLVAAGEVLGIRVLDHVVLGDGDWHSFADAGLLK